MLAIDVFLFECVFDERIWAHMGALTDTQTDLAPPLQNGKPLNALT